MLKVQVTVGRARREPCAKCRLPVFIAERLNVGKLLYHRTCFKCARCQSQLTLANYYETESGEFCCEICPDEEKLISKKVPSEHSVLSRSMSDEEKSASLLSFSEAPDAYSTHFESALEFPVDSELKKKFTLTQSEGTEFSKARSTFFNSQIEDSSDSSNEDVPPDLPESKPPLLQTDLSEKNANSILSDSSGFSSYKPDSNVISDSVSEQTNNHFVTKDNVSSSGGVSVRARMKLFENNDDNKSDVNRFSPTKKVPLTVVDKKQATVIALDDLEDFDNVSKKDIEIEDASLNESNNAPDRNVNNVIDLDEKTDKPKDYAIKLADKSHHNDIVLPVNVEKIDSECAKIVNEKPISISDDSVITVDDTNEEIETNHINKNDETHFSVDDSSVSIDENVIHESLSPSKPSANVGLLSNIDIFTSGSESSAEKITSKRKYYSAYEVHPSEQNNESLLSFNDDKEVSLTDANETFKSPIDENVSLELENNFSSLTSEDKPQYTIDNESEQSLSVTSTSAVPSSKEIDSSISQTINRRDETETIAEHQASGEIKMTETPESSKPPESEDLNPFGDEDDDNTVEASMGHTSLNPFGESDEEEKISPIPTPAPRPKKKIIPTLEERELKETPEALAKIYMERISVNPFEDDEDEEVEVVPRKPLPSPRQKKKIIVPARISLNPFDSDEDEDQIVPVPKPRGANKSTFSSPPEPKPRDTLSVLSKSSHGGSNSSISSGSAFGSARKKKPAPRPPLPFRADHSGSSSLTTSPSQSLSQSPNLSGTIRSRKNKRAPPPPKASTPNPDTKNISDRLPSQISPIDSDSATTTIPTNEDVPKNKDVKDEENRNKQNINIGCDTQGTSDNDGVSVLNKSTLGRWKRKKGQAPTRPIPERRIVKTLPISEIRRELDTIEIQQQGLEKQGVRLEQIIREKCEGAESTPTDDVPIDVEDLILQLFEIVNEKNELFRRQAELMYLRRQQRLEEEHADVEYQIRCIMMQPEANKTDSDKTKEEALINRLLEIVERRNEIIECLEMDRVREAEEDNSISSQLNLYSLKRDSDKDQPEKDKKEKKKKLKKIKKIIPTLHRHKDKEREYKVDIDKDVDETETNSAEKKKKKKFLF